MSAATRPGPLSEIVLVAVLFLAYKVGRLLIEGDVSVAFDNAWWVWNLERHLHLPHEVAVQHFALGNHGVLRVANIYYATVHFPATAAYLLWMYLRRPTHYRWARRSIAALTATALVVHVLMPLAPPRMLTATGILDTGRLIGPAVYGDVHADTLTNQYAAMPSLHVGWALAVAIGLIAATRGRWRWAWLLHPALTVAVVVVTGNHYWLDGIVATALLGVILVALPWPRLLARRVGAAEPPRLPVPRIPADDLPAADVPAKVVV